MNGGRKALGIKILITAVLLGGGAGLAFYAMHRLENPANEFDTYEALKSSGLIDAGWVPRYLPRSAYEIRETHNLGTNGVRLSFRYQPGDVSEAEGACGEAISRRPSVFKCREGDLVLGPDGRGSFATD